LLSCYCHETVPSNRTLIYFPNRLRLSTLLSFSYQFYITRYRVKMKRDKTRFLITYITYISHSPQGDDAEKARAKVAEIALNREGSLESEQDMSKGTMSPCDSERSMIHHFQWSRRIRRIRVYCNNMVIGKISYNMLLLLQLIFHNMFYTFSWKIYVIMKSVVTITRSYQIFCVVIFFLQNFLN